MFDDDDNLPDMQFSSLRARLARKRLAPETKRFLFEDDNCTSSGSASPPDVPTSQSVQHIDLNRSLHTISDSSDDESVPKITNEKKKPSWHTEVDTDTLVKVPEEPKKVCTKLRSSPTSKEPPPKKKRTAKDIEENKQKAEEKKRDREKIQSVKEADKEMKRIERESKKQFSLTTCLKYIKVLVDVNVVNLSGLGSALLAACEELGVSCSTLTLPQPFSILWTRQQTTCKMNENMQVQSEETEVEENDMLCLIPVDDFVGMVHTFKQEQLGRPQGCSIENPSLRNYVNQLKVNCQGKALTIAVQGLDQYFRDIKTNTQRNYREAVQVSSGHPGSKSRKNTTRPVTVKVSRVDIEEAVTATQLQTGTGVYMMETPEEVADLVKRFTKAVAERPAKKDRFDPIFSFHEEGIGRVKVDKSGNGLLKVWKHQLLQFKGVSPDVADAILQVFPSPRLLIEAYKRCGSDREGISLLENITVRRGAGVLETSRKIGKEMSRRIHMFFTNRDPDLVVK